MVKYREEKPKAKRPSNRPRQLGAISESPYPLFASPQDALPALKELANNSIAVIEIQWDFPTLNDIIAVTKRHAQAYNSMKVRIESQLVEHIKQQVAFHRIETPIRGKVRITNLWFVSSRSKDADNVNAAQKFTNDALVEAGVIMKDNLTQYTEGESLFIVDRTSQRVRIHIQKPKYNLI